MRPTTHTLLSSSQLSQVAALRVACESKCERLSVRTDALNCSSFLVLVRHIVVYKNGTKEDQYCEDNRRAQSSGKRLDRWVSL